MPKYFCTVCGYTANESDFLSGECSACCADTLTGKVNSKSIPKVFFSGTIKVEEVNEKKVNEFFKTGPYSLRRNQLVAVVPSGIFLRMVDQEDGYSQVEVYIHPDAIRR